MERAHIQGAATPFALSSDYRALGHNPALMTFDGWEAGTRAPQEGLKGVSIRSTFERTDLWSQLRARPNLNRRSGRLTTGAEALTDEDLHMSASFVCGTPNAWELGHLPMPTEGRWSPREPVFHRSQVVLNGGLDLFS